MTKKKNKHKKFKVHPADKLDLFVDRNTRTVGFRDFSKVPEGGQGQPVAHCSARWLYDILIEAQKKIQAEEVLDIIDKEDD